MTISATGLPVHPLFTKVLPTEVQKEKLELFAEVNDKHLHCEDLETWRKVHLLFTQDAALQYIRDWQAAQAKPDATKPTAKPAAAPAPAKAAAAKPAKFQKLRAGSSKALTENLKLLEETLQQKFHDSEFTRLILEAFQNHLAPVMMRNVSLAQTLSSWVRMNAMYLPLGSHLMESYRQDMARKSSYSKSYFDAHTVELAPAALSDQSIRAMEAFLAEVGAANNRLLADAKPDPDQKPTVIMLSVAHGAGGHTAPHRAMTARMKELGYEVKTLHYDTDLSKAYDPFLKLGITFEDGEPMTVHAFHGRWIAQEHNKEVSRVVNLYVNYFQTTYPTVFRDDAGADFIRKKVIPLNPKLIVTTLAYHWTWQTLAYRIPALKTLLVASDVFFHSNALDPYLRQKTLPPELQQMHFTGMTDDIELLKSEAAVHDDYFSRIDPQNYESWKPMFENLELDEQITVIGAPINPAFEAVTSEEEIRRLREKWNVPEGAVSVCISRGKLGEDKDLEPALEGYRTDKKLAKPVVIHVVCGENTEFYNRLRAGEYDDLGPNITIVPHPLVAPKDFAEIRGISLIDDIKAGGGSTFEGWYLISKGAKSHLVLTPGKRLWWENSNVQAMEKWGVGHGATDEQSKIATLEELIAKGPPPVTNRFPDWKKPFDAVVKRLWTGEPEPTV